VADIDGLSVYLQLVPVKFSVKTTISPSLTYDSDNRVYFVKAWGFTATAKVANVAGVIKQIKCGILRDMKYDTRKNIGGTSTECKSPTTAAWPDGFMPDSPSSTIAPNSPQPKTLLGITSVTGSEIAKLESDNYYTWTFGPDQPAVSLGVTQLQTASVISDEGDSRYYLYVEYGTSTPEPVFQVNVSFKNLFRVLPRLDDMKSYKILGINEQPIYFQCTDFRA
jgi:hypothetical protein